MRAQSKRASMIIGAGCAAWGERWQSPMARAAGVSQQLLAFIASGERQPTDDVYRKVAGALMKEARRVRKAADLIEEIAGEMLAELEE